MSVGMLFLILGIVAVIVGIVEFIRRQPGIGAILCIIGVVLLVFSGVHVSA